MISSVQFYRNPIPSFYWTAPLHMFELLRHSNGSHSCYVQMQDCNSIFILIKTFKRECIANTVLATATLWRQSTYITCPVNPYWQLTACLSYRNINYLNGLSGSSRVMTVYGTKNNKRDNVRIKPTMRRLRVSTVVVEKSVHTLLASGCSLCHPARNVRVPYCLKQPERL